jgi:hypothetical protein
VSANNTSYHSKGGKSAWVSFWAMRSSSFVWTVKSDRQAEFCKGLRDELVSILPVCKKVVAIAIKYATVILVVIAIIVIAAIIRYFQLFIVVSRHVA